MRTSRFAPDAASGSVKKPARGRRGSAAAKSSIAGSAKHDLWAAAAELSQQRAQDMLDAVALQDSDYQENSDEIQEAASASSKILLPGMKQDVNDEKSWERLRWRTLEAAAAVLRLSLSSQCMQETLQMIRQHRAFGGLNAKAMADHRWDIIRLVPDESSSEIRGTGSPYVGDGSTIGIDLSLSSPLICKPQWMHRRTSGCHAEHRSAHNVSKSIGLSLADAPADVDDDLRSSVLFASRVLSCDLQKLKCESMLRPKLPDWLGSCHRPIEDLLKASRATALLGSTEESRSSVLRFLATPVSICASSSDDPYRAAESLVPPVPDGRDRRQAFKTV